MAAKKKPAGPKKSKPARPSKSERTTGKPAKTLAARPDDSPSDRPGPAAPRSSGKAILSSRDPGSPLPIVGIGASAGGLQALEKFFDQVPEESGMAFVVVTHLEPGRVSLLPGLIQQHTRLPVHPIEDGMTVEPNQVFLIPPNRELGILSGTFQLAEIPDQGGRRLAIDTFFRSLAADQKENAICVILSGMGTDGTLGLKAVKAELGLAVVQDPRTADYDSMPRSAIQTGMADYVLAPEKMPGEIISYLRRRARGAIRIIHPAPSDADNAVQQIFDLVRSETGHDFSCYKPSTICHRLEKRLHIHQIEDVPHYLRMLQQDPKELKALFKEFLIGVTSFFRDPAAFEALQKTILPPMVKGMPANEPLRVWIPGSSTGEEAYSIAILLRELKDRMRRNLRVQIFATDIDPDSIQTARAGLYPASISADVGPGRLKRFFSKTEDDRYLVHKDIREMLVFAPHDLIQDPPFTKMHLISCRNLMIYLDSPTQRRLLPLLHYSLRPQGLLMLGPSETIGTHTHLFGTLDRTWKMFRRLESPTAVGPLTHFPVAVPLPRTSPARPEKSLERGFPQLALKALLEEHVPASAIVNERGDLLHIYGQIGNFLEFVPGEARMNVLEMARQGLRGGLAATIRKATSQGKAATQTGLRVKHNGGFLVVDLTVRPLTESGAEQSAMLVVFQSVATPARHPVSATKRARHGTAGKSDSRVEEMEKELAFTRDSLQSTIEERETTNEELSSANEELQSTIEELQSTNEELETSKEEMQSLNEEVTTVNAELQCKLDDLITANTDMKNFLDSTSIPIIFLDSRLCIKRFSSNAAKVINVIPSDLGRPIGHFVSNLKHDNLLKDAEQVLETLKVCEREVESTDGRWLLMRILPYRTANNEVDGLVITFHDIHRQKEEARRTEKQIEELTAARILAENVVDTIREPLLVLDGELRVLSANPAFHATFQIEKKETLGRFIHSLGDPPLGSPQLCEMLEQVFSRNASMDDFEADLEFPEIGLKKKMVLNARRIVTSGKDPGRILLSFKEWNPGRV